MLCFSHKAQDTLNFICLKFQSLIFNTFRENRFFVEKMKKFRKNKKVIPCSIWGLIDQREALYSQKLYERTIPYCDQFKLDWMCKETFLCTRMSLLCSENTKCKKYEGIFSISDECTLSQCWKTILRWSSDISRSWYVFSLVLVFSLTVSVLTKYLAYDVADVTQKLWTLIYACIISYSIISSNFLW